MVEEEPRKCACCDVSENEAVLFHRIQYIGFYYKLYHKFRLDSTEGDRFCRGICSAEKDMERHLGEMLEQCDKYDKKEQSFLDDDVELARSYHRAMEIASVIGYIQSKGEHRLSETINQKLADDLLSRLETIALSRGLIEE